MSKDQTFFVVLGEAICSTGAQSERCKVGAKHPILAIVDASTDDEAIRICIEKCATLGWLDFQWKRTGEFRAGGDDLYLQNAEKTARDTGFGCVVYDKPITTTQ